MNLMKLTAASLMAAALLAGCGGGGKDSGTSAFGTNNSSGGGSVTDPTAASARAVDVLSSLTQLGTGNGDESTITVVVKGAGSVVLASAPVTLVASSGILVVDSSTTNASGVVTATLKPGTQALDKANRSITVTATSGTVSGSVIIPVVGTTATYSGNTSLSLGVSTPLAISVKDSKGVSIPGATVTASASALGNSLTPSSAVTGTDGVANFTYVPTTAGNDALNFAVLGATVTANLAVSGEDFAFVSPASGTETTVGTPVTITVRYRVNGIAQTNKTVTFASTAGTLGSSTGVTDSSGQASTTVTSNFAGAATATAAIPSVGATTSLPLSFVATTPASLVLQVTPSAISPNLSGSVAQQAAVLARVTDANGNPVKGKTVAFTRLADPSNGNLSQGTVVTDANGEASVKYISGASSTSSGGVILQGTVQGTSVSGTAQLTVNQSALFIALGTGNFITNSDPQNYLKSWTVYVTDSNGVAVRNVSLTIRLLPVEYGKGSLVFDSSGTPSIWKTTDYTGAQSTSTLPAGSRLWCANEDRNNNGILDTAAPTEDVNGSHSLEPGNVISLSPDSNTVVTDSNGQATIKLQYAESYVPWVRVTLRASATVAGTESKKDATFVVVGDSQDFTSSTLTPAGVISPFGVQASCTEPN